LFLVKLDNQEHLVSIVTSRDVFGRIGKDFDQEQLYKAVAIVPKESSDGGKDLWLVDERGSCTEVPVNGDSQGPCEPKPSTLFTPEEMSSGTPLKVRLAKIARKAASSVYTIADPRASHTDLYAVYRDEKVVFIGNSSPDRFSTNTKILGYRKVRDLFRDTELGALELEGEYISYELASNGYIVTLATRSQLIQRNPKRVQSHLNFLPTHRVFEIQTQPADGRVALLRFCSCLHNAGRVPYLALRVGEIDEGVGRLQIRLQGFVSGGFAPFKKIAKWQRLIHHDPLCRDSTQFNSVLDTQEDGSPGPKAYRTSRLAYTTSS
jgi:hypothetical protein